MIKIVLQLQPWSHAADRDVSIVSGWYVQRTWLELRPAATSTPWVVVSSWADERDTDCELLTGTIVKHVQQLIRTHCIHIVGIIHSVLHNNRPPQYVARHPAVHPPEQ